ncbi:MAG: hypothetical protein WDA16_02780 [Candidatus Thermoplasmatota archaeon]
MNRRSLAALGAVITMLSMGFAGCLAPSEFLNASSSKDEITAMENKDLADNAAKAWSPNAKLGGVFGLELSNASSGRDDGDFPLDPNVGNGKAPAWIFVYWDEDTTRVFRVTADGRVKVENNTDASTPDDAKPLGAWNVDSDKALKTARTNATFADALKGDNATVAEGIVLMDGTTAYYFAAMSEGGMAFATVDAASGKLLNVKSFTTDAWKMPSYGAPGASAQWQVPVNEKGSGRVDSAKMTQEFPFTYAGGSAQVTLMIDGQQELPTDGVTWKLIKNDETVKKGSASSFDTRISQKNKIQLPGPGEYTLVISYDPNVPTGPPPAGGGVSFKWSLTSGKMPGM